MPCGLKANPETFPRNHRIYFNKRIVLGIQTSIAIGYVKKSKLAHHPYNPLSITLM